MPGDHEGRLYVVAPSWMPMRSRNPDTITLPQAGRGERDYG